MMLTDYDWLKLLIDDRHADLRRTGGTRTVAPRHRHRRALNRGRLGRRGQG